MTANIPNTTRKAVYQRDHYRCALCDSTDGIQVHHYVPRGCGGKHHLHNLITLCWRCHGTAHGVAIYEHMNADEATDAFFRDYNRRSPGHSMTAPEGVGYCLAVKKPGVTVR